jgi:hypothetical protein
VFQSITSINGKLGILSLIWQSDNISINVLNLILEDIGHCHTAIENLSDPIGYSLDYTDPYYTALAGNMKGRAKKDNSFWNHT